MKFILLGIGSGMPDRENHLSGLYVRVGNKNLLFDCGEGSAWQLLKHQLDGETLDAIFISHYHPDHVTGLFLVLQMLYLQKRQKPLQLFLPERPAVMMETLQLFYTFPQRFGFALQILDCREIELYHEEVSCALTDHLRSYTEFIAANHLPNQMDSFAFKISSEEGNLVYTSDISTTDCIQTLFNDCHTVIVDALHPTAAQILKLQYAGLKRVLLTHGSSPELKEALAEDPSSLFEFAREDQIYTLS